MRALWIIWMLGLAYPLIGQEQGFPLIRNYTPKEYGGTPQIVSVVQDQRGIIYFAGADLMEYDGVRWKVTPNVVRSLAVGRNNQLYISSEANFGSIQKQLNGQDVYNRFNHLIGDTAIKVGTVWSVKLTQDHAYYQSSDNIFQYSFTDEQLQVVKADTNGVFARGFVFRDTYYTSLSKQGMVSISDGQWQRTKNGLAFQNKNDFNAAIPYDESTVLIPTKTEGLLSYRPLSDSVPTYFSLSDASFIKNNQLYSGERIGSYMMVGSVGKGAVLFNNTGKIFSTYNEQNKLQNNAVYAIIQDTSKNIWLGLSNGLSKTEHGQDLSYWDKNIGLEDIVERVVRYQGKIYIATHKGLYFIDENNQPQPIVGIPTGRVWSMTVVKDELLVAIYKGVYVVKGQNASKVYTGSHAFELYQSVLDTSRIYTTDEPAFISMYHKNGQWLSEGQWEGIKDNIRGIIEDADGDIWLGTFRNGVIRVTPDPNHITKPKKVRYYTEKDGFASLKNILPFRVLGDIVWGTEKGLYIYNAQTDRFEPYCKLGEQFCNGSRDVFDLKEMPDGKIWICPLENKKADIGYLQPDGKGGYDWVYKPFRRIPEMFLVAFHVEPNGVVWIGGNEGVYRYDARFDEKNYEMPFSCLIRKVLAGKDSLLYGGSGLPDSTAINRVDYTNNTLKFEMGAPFFDQEEKTQYRYRLIGYQNDWNEWSRQVEKEYTNLFEGNYRFEAQAKNVYGNLSTVGTYSFEVLPPWYRHWLAYAVYLWLAIFSIRYGIKWYVRKLKADKERLESIVIERTAEVVQQKEELQTQAESLQQAVNRLKEMETFKEGVTGMLVHDLKNPLNAIMAATAQHEEMPVMKQVVYASRQMLRIVMDILDVQKLEDTNLELFKQPLRLQEKVAEAFGQANLLAEEKRISLENLIPNDAIVTADEGLLLRVFENLLTNAIKYTPIGGRVAISVSQAKEIGWLQIAVADNGQGIPDEKLQFIFEKFTQVQAKHSGKVRSTGLGLAFCKLATEAHGGRIWVESEPSKGSVFCFTLEGSLKATTAIQEMTTVQEVIYTEADKQEIAHIREQLMGMELYQGVAMMEKLVTIKGRNHTKVTKEWISQLEVAILHYDEPLFEQMMHTEI